MALFTRIIGALSLCGLFADSMLAQLPIAELNPRIVKFPARPISLTDVLKELEEKTGNPITDMRTHKSNPLLTLKTDTFWKSLDAIGKDTGIGFSAYQKGGGIALVDTPYRALKTDHAGLFRFVFKHIAVSRDEETRTHDCKLTLDVAWEPRLKLIYLNLDSAEVGYRKAKGGLHRENLARQVSYAVDGKSASPLEFQFASPERATRSLDYAKGTIRAIGAPKMLEFRFAKLEAKASLQEEKVRVAIPEVTKNPTRWSVDVATVYPKDAILPFESFQENDWMLNNRVWLSWIDSKTNLRNTLEPTGWSPQAAKEGIRMRHHFEARTAAPLPPSNAEATLHVLTPNRVVAFTVPFELQDLPLP